MKISSKLFLSHLVIAAFIFFAMWTYQTVIKQTGESAFVLGNHSLQATQLLKDLQFSGLRILSSTSELALLALLETENEGAADQANERLAPPQRTTSQLPTPCPTRTGPSPFPAAILLDIELPGMDGCDVVKVLKTDSTLRHIPVIATTAHDLEGIIVDCGADGYLGKPLEFDKLRAELASFCDEALPLAANS